MDCFQLSCQYLVNECIWENRDDDYIGPLGIDYQCINSLIPSSVHWHAFIAIILSFGITFWIRIIAKTATDFFSPTLQQIGIEAHLPDHVAGVTVLAFGNGAPDVFTVIASRVDNLLVGINTLLGGVMFVTTIVVGSIALHGHGIMKVNGSDFLRDIGFLLAAISCITVVVTLNTVSVVLALMFLTCYVIYITVVFHFGESSEEIPQYEEIISPHSETPSVPTTSPALVLIVSCVNTVSIYVDYVYAALECPLKILQYSTIPVLYPCQESSLNWQKYARFYPFTVPVLLFYWMGCTELGQLAEDILRPLLCLAGCAVLLAALYVLPEPPHLNSTNWATNSSSSSSGSGSSTSSSTSAQEMTSCNNDSINDRNRIDTNKHGNSYGSGDGIRHNDIASSANQNTDNYKHDNNIFKLPSRVTSNGSGDNLSIATNVSTADAITTSTNASFLSGLLTTHVSANVWLTVAFCSSIMWIDLLAAELVPCLAAMGEIAGIPKSFMGLTVLAWGNSVGDWFTNSALAANGKGLMALSGCYGAPVFNVLVGLGIALLLDGLSNVNTVFSDTSSNFMSNEGSSTSVSGSTSGSMGDSMGDTVYMRSEDISANTNYDRTSVGLSLCFLYLTLLSTAAVVAYSNYTVKPALGVYLMVLYALYTTLQCSLLYIDSRAA